MLSSPDTGYLPPPRPCSIKGDDLERYAIITNMEGRTHSLALPSPKSAPPGGGARTSARSGGPIVVGANGSGKTRALLLAVREQLQKFEI